MQKLKGLQVLLLVIILVFLEKIISIRFLGYLVCDCYVQLAVLVRTWSGFSKNSFYLALKSKRWPYVRATALWACRY